jgi:predicted dinucleotide-binding enzyme
MKIAVIGAGKIGQAVGRPLVRAGHEVTYGIRNPDHKPDVDGAAVTDIAGALKDADAVLLAVLGLAVPEVTEAHAAALEGKVVIDASNRFDGGPFNNYPAVHAAGGRYVRAFNIVGHEVIAEPEVDGVIADQYFSAEDDEARTIATQLIRDVGLRPVFVGGNDTLDILDSIVKLVIALAYKQEWGRVIAFRTLGGSNS